MKLNKNFIRKKSDLIFYQNNFLSNEECNYWIDRAPKLGKGNFNWDQRTINITKEYIVKKVINFFKKKLKLNLSIQQAQIQNWNVGSSSALHIHNLGNRSYAKYNSLIYLNDDFKGGEFFTKNGIIIKPKKGKLTLFNGSKVYHGVKTVHKKDRITLIFWWNN
jgi:hypothetical protein